MMVMCHLHAATPQPGPLRNSFAKTSTKWGQRRRHTEKILIPWGLEVRGWQLLVRMPTCSHLCVTHSAVLRHSPWGAVGFLCPLSQHQTCLFSILVMPFEKVRGNPSQPVRLFWCNEQPLYLIFQQCNSDLTTPSLCCTEAAAQSKAWGAFLQPSSSGSLCISADVDMHM